MARKFSSRLDLLPNVCMVLIMMLQKYWMLVSCGMATFLSRSEPLWERDLFT